MLEDAVGREDHQAGVVEADEHREHVGSLAVGERSLVAVVTVGDQQLAVGEGLGDAVGREPPEPGAVDLEVGLALGPLGRRRAFVEEEERLELGVHLAQQPQSALLRPAVRALVRQHDAVLVRLGLERRDESLTRARDSVWADVVLREPPEARLGLVDERAVLAPGAPGAAGFALVGGQRQVDDVVLVPCRELVALGGRDDVVGRGDEGVERAGALAVTNGAKRLHLGHGAGAYQPRSGLDSPA